jgi:hypothetical protein
LSRLIVAGGAKVSVSPVATRRDNRGKLFEIEIGDGLQGFGGSRVAKAVRQGIAPGGIFSLQSEQFGDGIVPTLGSGASICCAAVSEPGYRLLGLSAGAIAGLPFSVAESVFTLGLTTFWHGVFSVT